QLQFPREIGDAARGRQPARNLLVPAVFPLAQLDDAVAETDLARAFCCGKNFVHALRAVTSLGGSHGSRVRGRRISRQYIAAHAAKTAIISSGLERLHV